MNPEYSANGDPGQTLKLLWGVDLKPRRGRKPSLTPSRIGEVAIELADSEGLEGLSMRKLAELLSVSAMSLYRYVPGKAELLDLMLDRVYGELLSTADAGADWRQRLKVVARDYWSLCLRHPWVLQISLYRPALGPNAIQKYEQELGALVDCGLTDVEMDRVVSLISDYARGAARNAVDAQLAESLTKKTDQQWWQDNAELLHELVDSKTYPLATRVGEAAGTEYGAACDPLGSFDFGLERVLDGIAVLIEGKSA